VEDHFSKGMHHQADRSLYEQRHLIPWQEEAAIAAIVVRIRVLRGRKSSSGSLNRVRMKTDRMNGAGWVIPQLDNGYGNLSTTRHLVIQHAAQQFIL